MLEKLGMKPSELGKRCRMLDELKARIVAASTASRPRTVLRKPQPLLMGIGDVMLYPTCFGENINPYFASKELDRVTKKEGPIPWTSVPWKQDGWGAMVILDRGRAFDYLAWYRPAPLAEARPQKPTLDSLRGGMLWRVDLPGTCSLNHFRKMELEKIGTLLIDPKKATDVYPKVWVRTLGSSEGYLDCKSYEGGASGDCRSESGWNKDVLCPYDIGN
jgi:hypothetical protein